MDSLEQFLVSSAKPEPVDMDNNDNESISEQTFGDKLNEQNTSRDPSKRFDKSLANRYYNNSSDSMSKNINNNSLLHRIQSYKYKKQSHTTGAPLETRIHNTPLSYKAKYRKINENNSTFQSRDPRFESSVPSESSGYKLRKAYTFLDDMIVRDINIIEKQIKKSERNIKHAKKTSGEYDTNIEYHIQQKGTEIEILKNELIKLKNKKNIINENDLEQQAKSEMRKLEIDKVRKGIKTPYHHKLQRTRFGQVKWVKDDKNNNEKINIQNVYFKNKYKQLRKDGRLEKYMKMKTKRINSKFRAALKKKSGRGWNDT